MTTILITQYEEMQMLKEIVDLTEVFFNISTGKMTSSKYCNQASIDNLQKEIIGKIDNYKELIEEK